MDTKLVTAIQAKDMRAANEAFATTMAQKLAERLSVERRTVSGPTTIVEHVISGETLPLLTHKSVQKVFDATRSVSETEMLCGCSQLTVNGDGAVVSFVGDLTESYDLDAKRQTHPDKSVRDSKRAKPMDDFTRRFYMSPDQKKADDKKTAGSRDAGRKLTESHSAQDMLDAYLEAALWSSTDDNDEPLDANYDISDIAPDFMKQATEDCHDFATANAKDLNDTGANMSQHGHDFWLTRNGHGAGFWDRGYGAVGERLSKAAKVYGSVDLYVGDDGKVHGN